MAAKSFTFGKVEDATGFWRRFVGLMGRREVECDYALLFRNCRAIHCAFMKVDIDAIYLDECFTVLGWETVKPWELGHAPKGTRHVLECAAGTSEERCIGTGDVFVWHGLTDVGRDAARIIAEIHEWERETVDIMSGRE